MDNEMKLNMDKDSSLNQIKEEQPEDPTKKGSHAVFLKVGIHKFDHLYTLVEILRGASMLKWTTPDPCSGLSESDPKQYTSFEFYEIKIHKHLENI